MLLLLLLLLLSLLLLLLLLYPESAITSKANCMQVPFSSVRELGPTTKILFPMAVFLPRLMMLKVSMHENA